MGGRWLATRVTHACMVHYYLRSNESADEKSGFGMGKRQHSSQLHRPRTNSNSIDAICENENYNLSSFVTNYFEAKGGHIPKGENMGIPLGRLGAGGGHSSSFSMHACIFLYHRSDMLDKYGEYQEHIMEAHDNIEWTFAIQLEIALAMTA
ncbi:hypothetical protein M5K25_019913 [Dendrobium thyrsiflorum]|uniref:Uncharacterized protein n=1 Tax=Dendrobium thyrsiflorum TaxID=117978 RepID=A0ABD0UMY7_DENTH